MITSLPPIGGFSANTQNMRLAPQPSPPPRWIFGKQLISNMIFEARVYPEIRMCLSEDTKAQQKC
jgi:hypothetical protein